MDPALFLAASPGDFDPFAMDLQDMDFCAFIQPVANFAFFFEVDVTGFLQDDGFIHVYYFSQAVNASFCFAYTRLFE